MLTVGTIQVRMRDLGLIFSAAKWASTSARRLKKTSAGQTHGSFPHHILRAYGTGSQASMSYLQGWQVPVTLSAFHKVALPDTWRDTVAVYGFSPTA